jgi:hypothetical protein
MTVQIRKTKHVYEQKTSMNKAAALVKGNHYLPCPIVSRSMGSVALGDKSFWLFTRLVLVDESLWLVSDALVASSLIKVLVSSNFQSVKYPGFEVTLFTSISPDSIAMTRDIDGRSVGAV